MKRWIGWVVLGLGLISTGAWAQTYSSIPADVPLKPDPIFTPGALCQDADEFRYRERIRYCDRAVSTEIKERVFARYQQRYRFKHQRTHFKMDHYIPLCMGGSNHPDNLWPQHHTISLFTDKVEALLCKGMSLGKLRQVQAVEMMRKAKNDLSASQRMEQQLELEFGPG